MQICKCCRKTTERGTAVPASGVVCCGYGSAFDFNWYKFTLVTGWHCWRCLDEEIKRGLCQPLLVHYRDQTMLDGERIKRYRVRGVEWEGGFPKI